MQSQANRIYHLDIYIYIYIYIDHNTLRAKHATHQKAEYLRAASQHG